MVKCQNKTEKRAVIKVWKCKGKCAVSYDDNSAMLYDDKQACVDFMADSVTVLYLISYDSQVYYKCARFFITKC